MSKLKNLNVSESFDTYESEKVLNEWVINSKDAAAGVQKVIVTDKRLISVEKNEGKKYKKSSYNLEDIRTIDTFAGERKYYNWKAGVVSFMAGLILLLCGFIVVANNGGRGGYITLFVLSSIIILAGILLMSVPCYKNEVTISLELKPSTNVEILKISNKNVNMYAKSMIKLSFILTQTSIDMAKQIDNCVLKAQEQSNKKENN